MASYMFNLECEEAASHIFNDMYLAEVDGKLQNEDELNERIDEETQDIAANCDDEDNQDNLDQYWRQVSDSASLADALYNASLSAATERIELLLKELGGLARAKRLARVKRKHIRLHVRTHQVGARGSKALEHLRDWLNAQSIDDLDFISVGWAQEDRAELEAKILSASIARVASPQSGRSAARL